MMTSRVVAWGWLVLCAGVIAFLAAANAQNAAPPLEVDTALIVSVDVSNSVDEERYKLQMEGIAKALEDPEVLKAILNGPQGGILVAMVTWADKPRLSLPWQRIASAADAAAVAAKVRALPRQTGEFTCVSGMLRTISDKVVPQIPAKALRIIVDVSGDGRENCNPEEPPASVRDELAASGVTVNGLPILEGDEGPTLEQWYRDNIMGGPSSFILPAHGFGDFGRAIRQKFMIEISGLPLPKKEARLSN
ncbi:DUF1194 domain-containing protein [Hyphomicrobium sp. LHD-15]|nr:DUF1194 domain-containing protein [Hyphomicrobium sp. LHD-15]MDQ8697430.1 DUF1194 domain-containing protein [Hyphomicrobium sp. LHD-15]